MKRQALTRFLILAVRRAITFDGVPFQGTVTKTTRREPLTKLQFGKADPADFKRELFPLHSLLLGESQQNPQTSIQLSLPFGTFIPAGSQRSVGGSI